MVRVKKLANNYPTAEPVAKVKFFYFTIHVFLHKTFSISENVLAMGNNKLGRPFIMY